MRAPPPPAPSFATLPPKGSRGPARLELTVPLEVVTPILGGGYRAGFLDDVDVIRVPTIRGHLRFWWRALVAHRYQAPTALYDAECALWGGPGAADKAPRRSAVEVRVDVIDRGTDDTTDIHPQRTRGAYALFPARSESRGGVKTRDQLHRRAGVRFRLTISAPSEHADDVRAAARAWILFGGYGGRTRRGLGTLRVEGEAAPDWLPAANQPLADELTRLFARDIFERGPGADAGEVPVLAGAALGTIGTRTSATDAWLTALEALQRFRQGVPPRGQTSDPDAPSAWARQPGKAPEPNRPSISNWPEPDKVRHLHGAGPYGHTPRHGPSPVWPRASFGLPILGRFQTRARDGSTYREPPPFSLTWRERAEGDDGPVRDRLASPLIVKALPLASGDFVACVLWLRRDWPDGKVILKIDGRVVVGSGAAFDALVAPRDTARFSALANRTSMRAAFFEWLTRESRMTTVFRGHP